MQMCELKIHHLSHPTGAFRCLQVSGLSRIYSDTLPVESHCIFTPFFVKFDAWSPTPTRIGVVHSSGAFAALIIQQGQVNTWSNDHQTKRFFFMFFMFFSEQKSTFFITKKTFPACTKSIVFQLSIVGNLCNGHRAIGTHACSEDAMKQQMCNTIPKMGFFPLAKCGCFGCFQK